MVSLASNALFDGRYTKTLSWTDNGVVFPTPGDAGLAPGPYAVFAIANGIFSAPRAVTLSNAHHLYFLRGQSTLGAGTHDLTLASPTGGTDGTLYQTLSSTGQLLVRTALVGSAGGGFVFPTASGFATNTSIAGPWTLRARVRTSAASAAAAYLFALIKRHSDGAVIYAPPIPALVLPWHLENNRVPELPDTLKWGHQNISR